MTRKGTATFHPGADTHRVACDSSSPMMSAPTRVSQKEEKRPTKAADSAGTMVSAKAAGLMLEIGMSNTPARPARPAPRVQLTLATMRGDQPSAEAASWFSPTAEVASPNREYRDHAHNAAVSAVAIANSQSRSTGRMIDSLSRRLCEGRNPSTNFCWSP